LIESADAAVAVESVSLSAAAAALTQMPMAAARWKAPFDHVNEPALFAITCCFVKMIE
jgi:hypothetical protein